MKSNLFKRPSTLGFIIVLAFVLAIYFPTLQTIINGSSDDLLNDTGEIQVALNIWGTIHATGYPLFSILGNLFVSAARAVGVNPAAAPALFALLSGIVSLGLIYALALHLIAPLFRGSTFASLSVNSATEKSDFTTQSTRILAALATGVTILFALTRYAWIHNVIAEVYSFALLFQVSLLALALWQRVLPHRLEWLAFIGGLGIAHHRGLVLSIPPILYAVYPQLKSELAQNPRKIFWLLGLGLLGFLPYLYLPLRPWMNASWVYGDPGTLVGWWDQITARENPSIVSLPDSLAALADKFNSTNALLQQELTSVGILLGILGLIAAVRKTARRRAGTVFLISSLGAYAFMVLLFTDILAPVVFHTTLPLAFGWLFLGETLMQNARTARFARIAFAPLTMLVAAFFIAQNFAPIYNFTHDPSGMETIQIARHAPSGSTLVLEWGTRYYAIAFAQEVLGELKHVRRADDKADLLALAAKGPLFTFDYALYDLGIQWWQKKLGSKIYLRAAGPHIVQVDAAPQRLPPQTNVTGEVGLPIGVLKQAVNCEKDAIVVQVDWVALDQPRQNLSVFVHLQDRDGKLIAQADQSAPVNGWRPLTTWEPQEVVHDVYTISPARGGARIIYGLYGRLTDGQFRNYLTRTIAPVCESE